MNIDSGDFSGYAVVSGIAYGTLSKSNVIDIVFSDIFLLHLRIHVDIEIADLLMIDID